MKRSQFCKNLMTSGLACGCGITLQAGGSVPLNAEMTNETPCDEKMKFTQTWVKRFFDLLDQQVDTKTRTMLMRSNGAACAKGAYGELPEREPASLEEIDNTIAQWQQKIGRENIHRSDNIVYFNYVGNPKGLKISDGFCLCPMVENGPSTLSVTFCQCSVGYVQYMFRKMITFKPVEVELLESLRGGGKSCRFKVTI